VIDDITPEIEAMAGDGVSGLSKGGMKTKLMAAKTCVAAGCSMAITEGSVLSPLRALQKGANCTWFMAMGNPHDARKRWISSMKPMGSITIDDGAVRALMQGKSLLPAGVIAVSGQFRRGDMVTILDKSGRDVGQGLAAYAAQEAKALIGCNSSQIEKILGYAGRSALVHRDDMAI
jgi:glutamate 5-kinase